MSWVKIDDQFTDHPKIVQAGPLAAWLYVCGLTYANRYLTDGRIPAAQVRRLADIDGADALAARLVAVGLWEVAEDGYLIHDYLEYQPSAETVRKEREATAQRVQEWREKKRAGRNAQSNSVTPSYNNDSGNSSRNAVTQADVTGSVTPHVTAPPIPYPIPYPNNINTQENTVTLPSAPTPPERVDNFTPFFDAFWQAYPGRPDPSHRPHGREPTRKALHAIPNRDWDAVQTGAQHYAASRDVSRGCAMDPVRWLREERWREWQEAEPPPMNGAISHELSTRSAYRPSAAERKADAYAAAAAHLLRQSARAD